jgi:hypothetical protein
MKETTEKVYRCEFCNKALIRKGFMVLHERMCKSNPKNKHKCFEYCKHLIKDRSEYSGEVSFVCAKTLAIMYSYKLERFAHKAERIQADKLIRMPLECQLYELSDEHSDYGKEIVEAPCNLSCF